MASRSPCTTQRSPQRHDHARDREIQSRCVCSHPCDSRATLPLTPPWVALHLPFRAYSLQIHRNGVQVTTFSPLMNLTRLIAEERLVKRK